MVTDKGDDNVPDEELGYWLEDQSDDLSNQMDELFAELDSLLNWHENIPIQTEAKKPRKLCRSIVKWTSLVILAYVLAIFISVFFFRASRVEGDSMRETFKPGQKVYSSRVVYMFGGKPEAGDVVILDSSKNLNRNILTDFSDVVRYNVIMEAIFGTKTDKFWIKRVIGVPGDKIAIKNNQIYKNGMELKEDYINPDYRPVYQDMEVTVGQDEIFVMGDNRNFSKDSREVGLFSFRDIVGKVIS